MGDRVYGIPVVILQHLFLGSYNWTIVLSYPQQALHIRVTCRKLNFYGEDWATETDAEVNAEPIR